MADKSKKKGGGGKPAAKTADADAPKAADAVKAETPKAAEKAVEKAVEKKAELQKVEAEEASEAKKADAHPAAHAAHTTHDDDGHDTHGHKPDIREYLVIFVVLAVLTVIEVGITKVPGINRGLMTLALVGLAVTKAAIVGLFYMHLKHETKILKMTVAIPVMAPAFYALVLMSEAAWRLARW